MQVAKSKILLIGESESSSDYILKVLKRSWEDITFVTNIDDALKASMHTQFDLILCFYNLNDSNAFEVYSLLNRETNSEIPFVIIFSSFNETKLIVGVELGIDSFIFPSFDEKRIETLVNLQLNKNKSRKESERLKFDALSTVIPYGVFMAENSRIIEGNKIFFELTNTNPTDEIYFCDIFTFEDTNDADLEIFRINNGLETKTIIENVKISASQKENFKISFSFIKKVGKHNRIAGIIIPQKANNQLIETNPISSKNKHYIDFENITAREREVLQLSAKGIPVKQIAEQLSISNRTVEKHRSNIINKTNSENIVEAVFMYSKFMLNSNY